jgi:hypothetical protein
MRARLHSGEVFDMNTMGAPVSAPYFAWEFRFLVALPPASDLLLFAKHLFVAAIGGGTGIEAELCSEFRG